MAGKYHPQTVGWNHSASTIRSRLTMAQLCWNSRGFKRQCLELRQQIRKSFPSAHMLTIAFRYQLFGSPRWEALLFVVQSTEKKKNSPSLPAHAKKFQDYYISKMDDDRVMTSLSSDKNHDLDLNTISVTNFYCPLVKYYKYWDLSMSLLRKHHPAPFFAAQLGVWYPEERTSAQHQTCWEYDRNPSISHNN